MKENPRRNHLKCCRLDESDYSCPYSKAICRKLKQIREAPAEAILKEQDGHFLTNVVQGVVLDHLTQRLCSHYAAKGGEIETKVSRILMNHLSKNLFVNFRERVELDPVAILEVSCRLIRYLHYDWKRTKESSERYFFLILRNYFLKEEIGIFLKRVMGSREIKNEILKYRFRQSITNLIQIDLFECLLADADADELKIFERYVEKKRFRRFADMLFSGEWRLEARQISRAKPLT